MGDRSIRLSVIRSIIENNNIQSQEELLKLLQNHGYDLTQATLSRDLKELQVAKAHDSVNGYCYRIPKQHSVPLSPSHAVLSVAFSGFCVVIKTHPGFSGAVASLIDNFVKDAVLGTVAGDDTVFAIISEKYTRQQVLKAMSAIIPQIENKVK